MINGCSQLPTVSLPLLASMAGLQSTEARAAAERRPQRHQEIDDRFQFRILLLILLGVYLLAASILPRVGSLEFVPLFEFSSFLLNRPWMNAATFYREKLDHLVLNHATERNMLIIQSIGTCVALIWSVYLQMVPVLGC